MSRNPATRAERKQRTKKQVYVTRPSSIEGRSTVAISIKSLSSAQESVYDNNSRSSPQRNSLPCVAFYRENKRCAAQSGTGVGGSRTAHSGEKRSSKFVCMRRGASAGKALDDGDVRTTWSRNGAPSQKGTLTPLVNANRSSRSRSNTLS